MLLLRHEMFVQFMVPRGGLQQVILGLLSTVMEDVSEMKSAMKCVTDINVPNCQSSES